MGSKYLKAFNVANAAYLNGEKRDGCVRGWFSSLRHKGLNEPAKKLFVLLGKIESEEDAKAYIEKYFEENRKDFSNHSFGYYFLDALKAAFPHENWGRFDKPIVYYQGKLYRGDSRDPDVIFEKGFEPSAKSDNTDDYIKNVTGCLGVSTTKSANVACAYALPTLTPFKQEFAYSHEGYVYEIDYRGSKGIDVIPTLEARGQRVWFSGSSREVNIMDGVNSEDIICAYRLTRDGEQTRIENPNYKNPDQSRKLSTDSNKSSPSESEVHSNKDTPRVSSP